MKKFYYLIIPCLLYILLLTGNIPFYWHDYMNIYLLSGPWKQISLTSGFEFAFRPFANLINFLFFQLLGVISAPFRIFKAVVTVGVVLLIFFFVERDTGEKRIALLAALFYLTTSAVLQSVMLIYDFEIVVQFLLLCGIYFFFRAHNSEKLEWRNIILFIIITILALLTKESAKVFVGVLCFFVLLTSGKKRKYFIIPCLILILFAIKPGIIFGIKDSSSYSLMNFISSWYSVENFVQILKYLVISAFGVIVVFLTLFLLYLKEKKRSLFEYFIILWKNIKEKQNQVLLFFGLWFIATALLTLFVPLVEKRYAIVPILPFTIVSFVAIGKMYRRIAWKRWLHCFFIVLICITILSNIGLSLKYRYGFGNFFILLDESYKFTEKNYEKSIFFYTDSTAHFFNLHNQTSDNEYLEYYYFNISMSNMSKNKTVFLYALINNMQVKERNKTTLEKTFLKGPHCFMLYKLGEKEITEIPLEREEQSLLYTFSKQTQLSYCSISIETRFFVPKEIQIIFVGEDKNVTTAINPPIGKYKSCEYICPTGNVTKVEVKTERSILGDLFNEVYGARLHIIKK